MLDWLATDYTYASGNVARRTLKFNREHYRTLGELALLYESTLDPALKARADALLAYLYPSQAANGWLPGIKTNNWFSQSLNVAQRAFPDHEHALRELLRRWQEHYGSYLEPGNTGGVDGPLSAWDLLTLEEHTGDANDLRAAAEIVRAQASGFHEDPNEWRGLGVPPAHELGPMIRDWVSVIGRLSALPEPERPAGYAPAAFFSSGLTTALPKQWYGRHVFFVLDETDAPLTVLLDFNAMNSGYHVANRIRVIAPGGAETVIDQVLEPAPTELLTLENYGVPSPFTPDALSTYHKASTLVIPPDGQTGAYAVEYYSTNLEPAVFARSSAGKLVHYFPDYVERAQHVAPWDLYYLYGQFLPGVSSSRYGAQAWYQPRAALPPVTLVFAGWVLDPAGQSMTPLLPGTAVAPMNFPLGHPWPSIRASHPDGSAACRTSIAGTTTEGWTNPAGASCVYTPASVALQSFVTTNEAWHYRMFLEGIEPFVSATPEEWFDPREYPSPPLAQFLVPRD
jgi:hypothetical protein